jgi:flagellar protein FliS
LINSPYQKYQQTQLQTASKPQLLLMLYEGAIRFLRLGISGIEEKNNEKANTYLCKTQTVIHELIASLNHAYPMSQPLSQVYEYMVHQLIQANMKKNAVPAKEVLSYLIELRDAWDEASKSLTMSMDQAK